MEIRNFNQNEFKKIYDAFCKAFLDYSPLTNAFEEETKERWLRAGVDYKLSYGAFEQNKLAAFVLNVKLGKTLYNFSTGVIPDYRRRRLIQSIYKEIPHADEYVLEVLCTNAPAIRLYLKLGYEITRKLISLEGRPKLPLTIKKDFSYAVKPYASTAPQSLISMYVPATESQHVSLERNSYIHETHELYLKNELVAFAHFTPSCLELHEVGAQNNDTKYLDQLFLRMKLHTESFRVLNIDEKTDTLIRYFQKREMKIFASQYEMRATTLRKSFGSDETLRDIPNFSRPKSIDRCQEQEF